MPTARRSRTIPAPPQELWELIRDPHHLPRWWPRVTRVEGVEGDAFTEVMLTRKGKTVRADFTLIESNEEERTLTWAQRIEGTPFARVLQSAETEVRLAAPGAAAVAAAAGYPQVGSVSSWDGADSSGGTTEVTIELRQTLTGIFPRLGGMMVSRAAAATIEEALNGLERISA
jgi:uncharacterized protein YndB with AHSA1/START domain